MSNKKLPSCLTCKHLKKNKLSDVGAYYGCNLIDDEYKPYPFFTYNPYKFFCANHETMKGKTFGDSDDQ